MGVSLHFGQAKSETGRELRSRPTEKTELSSRYVFSQPVHPSNVWKAAYEGGRRCIEK